MKSTAGSARARKSAPKSPGQATRSSWCILKISVFKTFIGKEAPRLARFDFSNLKEDTTTLLQGTPIARDLRKGMLLNGVDLMRVAGFVSAAHTPEIVEETVQAFDRTIARMQQEGLLA